MYHDLYRCVDLYNRSNIIQKRDVQEYLENHVPTMKCKKNNNRIMDIGSADGSVTMILRKFLPPNSKLLGCDINKNMVKFATDHYSNDQTSFTVLDIAGDMPEEMKGTFDHVFSFYTLNWVIDQNHDQISFTVLDIVGDMPEEMKRTFDHVFSFYTLNWVMDQKRAFQNIFDLLDQNGECFMVLVANNPVFDVYRTLEKNSKWSTWVYDVEKYISPYHDSQEPGKEIAKLMENIGFVDVNVKCSDKFFLFDDENMWKNLISALSPFKIPKDKNDEFMKDYIQVMNDIESVHKVKTNHSPKDITFHYQSVLMYGRKPLPS